MDSERLASPEAVPEDVGDAPQGSVRLEEPVRLSEFVLWTLTGARRVPPPSPAFVARAFVRAVRAFQRDAGGDAIDVLDLNAGDGRFGFSFLQAWAETGDAPAVRYVLRGRAGDVESWQGHPQLAELAESGRLDFETDGVLRSSPLVVIANDAFAGLPQDAFAVLDGQLLECRLTLDAPAGTVAERGRLDALHDARLSLGHDYRHIDLPFYEDEVLDGLLEEYRRELTSGHVLLPVGAFELVRRLAEESPGGLLLLHAGSGPMHLGDLRDAPSPWPIRRDGAVRLPVNFHALGRGVEALGGRVFQPRTSPSDVAVSAWLLHVDGVLPATHEILGEWVGGHGPDATAVLLRQLESHLDEAGFDGVLAYLKLSDWDTLAARRFLPRLQALVQAGLTPAQRAALLDAAEQTWNVHLHLGEPQDLAFEWGTVLQIAGLHRPAVELFTCSLERYGDHTATFFNLALGHLRLGEHDLARWCVERSLELDPEIAGARDLALQIDNAEESVDVRPVVRRVEPSAAPYPSNLEHLRGELQLLADGLELGELAGRFRLRSAQVDAAAHRLRAHLRSRPEDAENALSPLVPPKGTVAPALYAACRQQCFVSLDGLAERIESVHGWDDLVVPGSVKSKLRGIESWLRYRHVVHHNWGFAQRLNAGRGMAAMFCGSSGTGKIMAAGILGRLLDLDLYRIDLSSVVSKYIGETEKNLAKTFDAAEAANAILFFDEADALFGKRSEVKDAHDRHANIEVSYLLQRMENYDGIAILATNIKDNLDVAFARRLQVIVEFPFPTPADRERIWRRLFPAQVPQAPDVDMVYLAKQFNLSGGSIKNCALAAAEEKPVEMRHLVMAVVREYEKLGKPVTQSAFGEWGHLVG